MNFLNRIFRSNMVDCPRCLGKGKVDLDDIKRLKKELFWSRGKCAYCNGNGKVPPDRIEKVSVDLEYLTTDLPSSERHRVINNDADALKRAEEVKQFLLNFVSEIERLYYIENKEAAEIAEQLFHQQGRHDYNHSEKEQLMDYIDKVIKSKLGKLH